MCVALGLCACSSGSKVGPWLQGFGFSRPIPAGFLYPGNEGFRRSPPPETRTAVEYKNQITKLGASLDFEYEPDRSWIVLSRYNKNYIFIKEEFIGNMLTSGGHDIGSSGVHYVHAIDKPRLSTCSIAGKTYKCATVLMATNQDPQQGLYSAMIAVRNLPSYDQQLIIYAYTPGKVLNLAAVEKLLQCVDLN